MSRNPIFYGYVIILMAWQDNPTLILFKVRVRLIQPFDFVIFFNSPI